MKIDKPVAYINVSPDKKEFSQLKKEVLELEQIIERAKPIMEDLAHKEVNIKLIINETTSSAQYEDGCCKKDIGILPSEAEMIFRT